MFQTEEFHDARQFLVIELHDIRDLHRFRQNFPGKECLAQVDVEDPYCFWPRRPQKLLDRTAAGGGSLGE